MLQWCLTRRVTTGLCVVSVLVMAILVDCSTPVTTYVETKEIEAGVQARFPWSRGEELTLESEGGVVTLAWPLGLTVGSWISLVFTFLLLLVSVATFVKKDTVVGAATCLTAAAITTVTSISVKAVTYVYLAGACAELESDVAKTGEPYSITTLFILSDIYLDQAINSLIVYVVEFLDRLANTNNLQFY